MFAQCDMKPQLCITLNGGNYMWNQRRTHDVSGLHFGLVEKVVDNFEVRQRPGVPCLIPVGVEMCGKKVRVKNVFHISLWVYELMLKLKHVFHEP
jgi:hypothetical protein